MSQRLSEPMVVLAWPLTASPAHSGKISWTLDLMHKRHIAVYVKGVLSGKPALAPGLARPPIQRCAFVRGMREDGSRAHAVIDPIDSGKG